MTRQEAIQNMMRAASEKSFTKFQDSAKEALNATREDNEKYQVYTKEKEMYKVALDAVEQIRKVYS